LPKKHIVATSKERHEQHKFFPLHTKNHPIQRKREEDGNFARNTKKIGNGLIWRKQP
jgi:hypothetical protein